MTEQQPTIRQIIAGAIYDFAGGLTCRNDPITLGATHNAAPAAEACDEFLKKRGCAEGEPAVRDWTEHLAMQAATTPQAFAVLKAAMQADHGYAWSWHCNIAVAAADEGLNHAASNRAAARFVQMCFGVDTSHPRRAAADKPCTDERMCAPCFHGQAPCENPPRTITERELAFILNYNGFDSTMGTADHVLAARFVDLVAANRGKHPSLSGLAPAAAVAAGFPELLAFAKAYRDDLRDRGLSESDLDAQQMELLSMADNAIAKAIGMAPAAPREELMQSAAVPEHWNADGSPRPGNPLLAA